MTVSCKKKAHPCIQPLHYYIVVYFSISSVCQKMICLPAINTVAISTYSSIIHSSLGLLIFQNDELVDCVAVLPLDPLP